MNCRHLGFFLVLVLGLPGGRALAQQEATDMHLEDVGFVMRLATPQQVERLRLLPPHKFVARTVGGRRYYIYADPELCKCAFFGDETAMQSYRDLASAQAPAPSTSSGGFTPGYSLIEEMNPELSSSIGPGDILDY